MSQSCSPNASPSTIDADNKRRALSEIVKTHLHHLFTAVAITLVRIDAGLTQMPPGQRRQPPLYIIPCKAKVCA